MVTLPSLTDNSLLSSPVFFSDIIFADSNPYDIEIVETKKIDDKIIKLSNKQTYHLFSKSCHINDFAKLIEDEFITSIKTTINSQSLKYFKDKWYKFFYRKNPNIILEVVSGSSWIFTSSKLLNDLVSLIEVDKNISHFNYKGKLKNVSVFTHESIKDNEIFYGTNESLMAFVSKNYNINDENVNFELLIYNLGCKKLLLE